jgi:transcriptional regulator with XRE-family HTH domain
MTELSQDRLGVLIGLDEACSSARISRYEGGIHEPPFKTAERIAAALGVPVAYFYCPDETLTQLLLSRLPQPEQERLLTLAQESLGDTPP